MRGVAGARIWYQSFTDPDADRPYFARLEAYLSSVASPDCQVAVSGIQPGARYPHPITDFRCAARVIANALTAEEQGYDAFVIGNFGEAGLAEARSAVRIPVIGLGEATMLHACTLGRKIGLAPRRPAPPSTLRATWRGQHGNPAVEVINGFTGRVEATIAAPHGARSWP
jgi:hypothetical protein